MDSNGGPAMTRRINYIFRTAIMAVMILGMTTISWGAGMRIVPSAPRVTPGEDLYFDVVAEGIPAEGLGEIGRAHV